jgi:TRAP-type uncharacterized transport system fused permease subunit
VTVLSLLLIAIGALGKSAITINPSGRFPSGRFNIFPIEILPGAMLADARFRDTAAHAMKLSLTTFIVPFAFVYSPELMAFPSLSWDVLWAVIEVLIVQLAVSACAYGYLFRSLAAWERAAFGLVGVLAFMAMTQEPVIWSRLAYGTGTVLLLWLSLPRLRLAAS